MHYLLRAFLFLLMLVPLSSINKTFSQEKDISALTQKLEVALNKESRMGIKQLFHRDSTKNILKEFEEFRNHFNNPKWEVSIAENRFEKNNYIDVRIKAERIVGTQKYNLDSKQLISVDIKDGKISDYKVISEESILKSSNSFLSIELNIPDSVLTGTKYDVEIILKEPLGDYIIAAGLVEIKGQDKLGDNSPKIELKPVHSGGLFKSVQAPLKEGSQTWAALIAHPEGLTAITKVVNITSDKEIIPKKL